VKNKHHSLGLYVYVVLKVEFLEDIHDIDCRVQRFSLPMVARSALVNSIIALFL